MSYNIPIKCKSVNVALSREYIHYLNKQKTINKSAIKFDSLSCAEFTYKLKIYYGKNIHAYKQKG